MLKLESRGGGVAEVPRGIGPCVRCREDYREHGASASHELHRSRIEQVAWLQLEHVLETPNVHAFMFQMGRGLHGMDLGYVVEVMVVDGWKGRVDIFVPHLKLCLQVDGDHHRIDVDQIITDFNFNQTAVQHGFRVLRLYHDDEIAFDRHIRNAVLRCMHDMNAAWAECTPRHPQNDVHGDLHILPPPSL